ncbi:hypothetical protein ACQ4PT_053801 [Festuca glaucescens]
MKVLYTNMASSVESWLVEAEGVLDASARKIVGLDVEYDKSRDSYFRKKKAAVIQLCYGENVLVYHIYHADEKCPKLHDFLWGWRYIFARFCIAEDKNILGRADLPVHNLKDIQQIWRDPEKSWKRTQGLKDVAAAIIDPYYEQMKDGFGNTEHSMWANAPPLPEKHLEYAARDAYATYESYVDEKKNGHGDYLKLIYLRGAPSIDEAAAPISQEDSLPEGPPSIDEAAAPNRQEVSLPVDAPSVEDAPSIADASLFVQPAGDTLEKTGVDSDSEQTESDNVGDGKEDTEGGNDDLNDAKEDLQDGTGGDDAFFEHGAAPLAESPLVSLDSQIVPFEPVEKSVATPDVPSAAIEHPPKSSDFVPASEYVEFDPDIFTSQRWNADISSQEDAAVRDAVIKCDPINISSQDDPAVKNAVNKSDEDGSLGDKITRLKGFQLSPLNIFISQGILPNGVVAVKRILNNHTIDEKLFYREVDSLLNVNHHNIVRFLGYCATTDQTAIKIEDELRGLEWGTRYKLIKDICQAMNYLHMEKHIIHMDLKPDNILLDDNMVAKVTDFGLSRLDGKSKTMSEARCGSFGYMAPEYLHGGWMSVRSDIYSLGVIIIELVTGYKDIAHDKYNAVLRRWRHRLRKSGKETSLSYQQVTKCIEIGLRCKENDPFRRPFIDEILRDITNVEDANRQISKATESTVGQICPYTEDDILGIEPLQICFPFNLKKQISCSFQLTNDTDAYIAFDILTSSPLPYSIQPMKDIVPPQSKRSVNITLQSQEKAPRDVLRANEFTVRSAKLNGPLACEDITTDMFNAMPGDTVDEVNLDVFFDTELQNKPLDVLPPKLLFPFQPNKLVPCSLNITNNSNEPVVFMLKKNVDNCHRIFEELMKEVELGKRTSTKMEEEMSKHLECFVRLPLSGIIPAQSTCTLVVTTLKKENLPEKIDDDLVLMYCKAYEFTHHHTGDTEYSTDFRLARIFGSDTMHSVALKAAYVAQGEMTFVNLVATVEVKNADRLTTIVSVLFVARKQWFLVWTSDSLIHVYNYKSEMQEITRFSHDRRSVTSLVVHPTHPYVLSLAGTEIKAWDWDKGWECIRTFKDGIGRHVLNQIAIDPTDTNSFAAASESGEVKVWNFDSPEPKYTLSGHSKQVNCLYFFTRDDQQFLLTGSSDKTAKIWDMQQKICVKTLEGFLSEVISVISHPNLPLLITGTRHGPFYLWSSINFR